MGYLKGTADWTEGVANPVISVDDTGKQGKIEGLQERLKCLKHRFDQQDVISSAYMATLRDCRDQYFPDVPKEVVNAMFRKHLQAIADEKRVSIDDLF